MTGFVEKKLAQIDKQKLPQHIGIIMDGNGRWALSKGRPRTFGHVRGAEALRMAVEGCRELGISALTVFAFSTENWQRPFEEVSFLMNLLLEYLDKEVDALDKQGIRFKVIGDTSKFSPLLQKKIVDSEAQTKNNTAMILNIALN
jgi:undecaprenyl diphosphate synthase